MSTPSKGHIRPPIPPVSSITEESDCEGYVFMLNDNTPSKT